ncbi:ISJP4 transposase TnpA (plasmid) [Cupriavidus necator N-1]|uniref:ISJP4 transposase TnpA n=1 Tax=Cupriavidus necator (strain ATCC 43291 / DSM 13513 / CCUG 52238 / LMG 8453 / N-1) TaxID=1042878 RepID=F8GWA0_CUPNN|nr:ISJP4 transposase TnpA [Cupriavidus necator N-1]
MGWLLLRVSKRRAIGRRPAFGAIARATAGEVTRGRRARFLPSSRRFIVGASRWGGRKTGPNPTDRSRPGSKHHILVDAMRPHHVLMRGFNFRCLRIRFERRADIHEAFLKLGCSLVCWNIFRRAEPSF